MEDVAREINRPTTGHGWTDGGRGLGVPGGRVPQEPLRGSQQGRPWSVQMEGQDGGTSLEAGDAPPQHLIKQIFLHAAKLREF